MIMGLPDKLSSDECDLIKKIELLTKIYETVKKLDLDKNETHLKNKEEGAYSDISEAETNSELSEEKIDPKIIEKDETDPETVNDDSNATIYSAAEDELISYSKLDSVSENFEKFGEMSKNSSITEIYDQLASLNQNVKELESKLTDKLSEINLKLDLKSTNQNVKELESKLTDKLPEVNLGSDLKSTMNRLKGDLKKREEKLIVGNEELFVRLFEFSTNSIIRAISNTTGFKRMVISDLSDKTRTFHKSDKIWVRNFSLRVDVGETSFPGINKGIYFEVAHSSQAIKLFSSCKAKIEFILINQLPGKMNYIRKCDCDLAKSGVYGFNEYITREELENESGFILNDSAIFEVRITTNECSLIVEDVTESLFN